jgi:hypothetical protein
MIGKDGKGIGAALAMAAVAGVMALLATCATGCRSAGPQVSIHDSPHAYIVVGETTTEAQMGKTVSTDAVNPQIRDNAVPVYSSGSASTTRNGDAGATPYESDAPAKEVTPAPGGGNP